MTSIWQRKKEARAREAKVRDDMAAEKRRGGPPATSQQHAFIHRLCRNAGLVWNGPDPERVRFVLHPEYKDQWLDDDMWLDRLTKSEASAAIAKLLAHLAAPAASQETPAMPMRATGQQRAHIAKLRRAADFDRHQVTFMDRHADVPEKFIGHPLDEWLDSLTVDAADRVIAKLTTYVGEHGGRALHSEDMRE